MLLTRVCAKKPSPTNSFEAKQIATVAILLFASPLAPLHGQIRQQDITKLKGVEATALVSIGDTGFIQGITVSYPVNTLAYPEGQVVYRVEWMIARGAVQRMEKSFGVGTPLEITNVDFKDDRLELKVVARDRDSGRLKLMLGTDWQKRMTNATVMGP